MSLLHIHPTDLVNSSILVREPVYKVIKEIELAPTKKIILAGPKHSGKSIVLSVYLKGNNGIYMFCSSANNIHWLPIEERAQHYELKIANKIYHYLKDKYSENINYKYFIKDHEKVIKQLDEFIDYANKSSCSGDILKPKQLRCGDLVKPLLSKIKEYLDIESISLTLDHFDWVDKGDFQDIMRPYMDIFDKTVITTDDKSVYHNEERINNLSTKGFTVVDVDYGKDLNTAKEIITADVTYHNEYGKNKPLFEIPIPDIIDIINPDFYDNLIQEANGDFGILFSAIRKFYERRDWYCDNLENFYPNREIKHALEAAKKERAEIEKRSYENILYL